MTIVEDLNLEGSQQRCGREGIKISLEWLATIINKNSKFTHIHFLSSLIRSIILATYRPT